MSDCINSLGGALANSVTSSKDTEHPSRHRHRPADLQQQAQLFRSLMAKPLTAQHLAAYAARRDTGLGPAADDPGTPSHSLSDEFRRRDLDISAGLMLQRALDQAPSVQGPAPAATPDLSMAELIEKHVRRMVASQETEQTSTGGEVRLVLSDAVLPGTALALQRTADGWRLSALADNEQSLERLRQFAPALVERFAQASLGRLEISIDGEG